MLNRIIEFSVKNKLIIALFVLALIGYGAYEVSRLPIDAVPDITDNQVQVITTTPALGAPDVERFITFPIEQASSNIPGIKEIRSFSRFGLSLVTIVFTDATDIYWARQQVAERLQQVQQDIPKGIGTPTLAPVTTGLGEVYQYVVRAKPGYERKYDAMQLRTIQDWLIRKQLLGAEGVADVSSFGGYLKQYEVAVNTAKLASYGIGIDEVFAALENNNNNTGGAYIEKGPTVLYIRSEGLAASVADIERIVIKQTANGAPLLVRDVADVRIGHAVRYGAMCYNDEGEVAGAVVMMLKGGNSGQVIKNIKQRIAAIQKTLPEGVVIEPFLDRTKMVNNAIGTVEKNLLEGSLIVVFILVLFLGNLRAGLLVASIIPLSMLFAIIMMNLFGVSGNLMSLGALDFGLIVDGAVIIVEAVMHAMHGSPQYKGMTKLDKPQMDTAVKSSASRMMNSAVFGQIIILVVYLPIFSLQGIEGKMFKPMAQTVAFALLGAFILSLTYIPMMSAAVLSRKVNTAPGFSDRMMHKLEQRFSAMLSRILHYPKLVIGTVLLLFATAVAILASMGGEFIPQLEEGDFAVDTRVLTGSNLNTTIASTQQAAGILLKRFPEVEKVVTKIGSGEIPTDPMPMEASDMMVILKDKKEWISAATFPEMAQKMGDALSAVPGITTGFQFPVQMRFNELMTGARQDVVCKIFGENLDTLAQYATLMGKLASQVDGAKDVYVEKLTGMPQIVVEYNRDALAQYGMNIADVNKVVNTAFAGQSTGLVYEGEKRFDLVVRLAGDQRRNIQDVQNLLVPAKNGSQVPLYQLASVAIKEGPAQIQREDAKRRVIIGFNVRGRDVQSIVKELQQKVAQSVKLPAGYYITYGGAFENLLAAKQRLSIVVPIALGLILLMLYFAFGSFKHGLIIYSAIPLSAIGGVFALAARGMPFSISAGVGFIALFGVAVLNGIVLVAEFRRLKKDGVTDASEAVLQGTRTRLRPVLMTAAVASLGFLPMALSNGAGAEVQRPLATVVIGGLLSATFLTLFLLPVLYVLFEKMHFKMKKNTTILLLLLALPFGSMAQQNISLQSAIDTALQHNLQLQGSRLRTAYLEKMKGTAWNINNTSLNAEWGNVNSAYNDTRYGISQSIAFPTLYTSRQKLLRSEWQAGIYATGIREKELVRAVTQCYYEILYLRAKQQLLQTADSTYALFEEKAMLRYKLGESNVLEKNAAASQRTQVYIQLQQAAADMEILQSKFAYLLGTGSAYTPADGNVKMALPLLEVPGSLQQHPQLQYLRQQQQVARAQRRAAAQQWLPELQFGYFNQSFGGWQKTGAVEQYYTRADRFSSYQAGIGIPLFSFSQAARMKALRIDSRIADNQLADGTANMEMQYRQALSQYGSYKNIIDHYETFTLGNTATTMQAAAAQYQQGDIDYLQYTLLINQAISLRSSYLDAVKSMNETITEINYLTK